MSLISTLEDDFAEVRTKVEEFAESKLPTALSDVKKLEGNPVIDALLSATHVPQSALNGVVSVIQALADAFPKDAPSEAVSEPQEADAPADAPQPIPAGPVVAGQA